MPPGYCCAPIVGGLVVFLSARPQRHERAFDLFDAAALGLFSVTVLHHLQLLDEWTAPAAALAFGLRVLALRRNWRTPRPRFWRNPFVGMRAVPEPPQPEAHLGHMGTRSPHGSLAAPPARPGRTTPP
ncbi:hypothetical protein [Streptomyces hokutonensis]|uniref:hypothetical protein n=1 Tax=Streptomyces hokutonensis TaxID=1306990 RepID=UPI000C7F526B|nr:hypothetical protein [Streptomyces hokutonensis]